MQKTFAMLTYLLFDRPIELVQATGQLQPVKEAFSPFFKPENMLSFMQTPEFRLFTVIVAAIIIATIVVHVGAWVNMLLAKEETTTPIQIHKRMHAPPSQSYLPKALLWQSSRVGLVPEYGLVEHKSEEPEQKRQESIPTRGGDLPTKPTA